ncbi:MAG: UDP-2,3-diacylglucosamine diphosphatase [Psittacicella sp.]
MSYSIFIADIHLSENNPELTKTFTNFLINHKNASKIYILGDLFDYWLGDDIKYNFLKEIENAFSILHQNKVEVFFQAGNRDFLIGSKFCRKNFIIKLDDYHILKAMDKKILLCHGDTLCTDDIKYQKFRKKINQKWRQFLFLHLPSLIRKKIGRSIRERSLEDKKLKSMNIMDINTEFFIEKMNEYKCNYCIHGHTHKISIHIENSKDKKYRYVLDNWENNKDIKYLKLSNNSLEFLSLES